MRWNKTLNKTNEKLLPCSNMHLPAMLVATTHFLVSPDAKAPNARACSSGGSKPYRGTTSMCGEAMNATSLSSSRVANKDRKLAQHLSISAAPVRKIKMWPSSCKATREVQRKKKIEEILGPQSYEDFQEPN